MKHPLAITNAWDFLRCYLRYTTNKEAKKEIQLICMQYFLRVVFQDILNFRSLKNSIEQQEYLQQTRYRRVPIILRRLGFNHKRYDARFQFKFFCIHNFMRGTVIATSSFVPLFPKCSTCRRPIPSWWNGKCKRRINMMKLRSGKRVIKSLS